MSEKIKAFVPKTFNDAGTGQTFEGGKEHSFEAGAHGNYQAAGLIVDAPVKDVAAATDTVKTKP